MATKTKCQTPNAVFHIKINTKSIQCKVNLPFELELPINEAKQLEANIHNVLEIVLSKYFTSDEERENRRVINKIVAQIKKDKINL